MIDEQKLAEVKVEMKHRKDMYKVRHWATAIFCILISVIAFLLVFRKNKNNIA